MIIILKLWKPTNQQQIVLKQKYGNLLSNGFNTDILLMNCITFANT